MKWFVGRPAYPAFEQYAPNERTFSSSPTRATDRKLIYLDKQGGDRATLKRETVAIAFERSRRTDCTSEQPRESERLERLANWRRSLPHHRARTWNSVTVDPQRIQEFN